MREGLDNLIWTLGQADSEAGVMFWKTLKFFLDDLRQSTQGIVIVSRNTCFHFRY